MIGGIGPAATEFYYRNLVSLYTSSSYQLELTIVHADVNQLVANIASGSPDDQARIYLDLALRLQNAGADVIVISSIAGHFCMPEFEKVSPLPIISILPALDAEFRKRKLTRVGLLGNQVTMETKLFGGISSAEVIIPRGQELDLVHGEYLKMAVSGSATDRQRDLLFKVGKSLGINQGAEVVVLAGTDLFLAFEGHDCGFEVIDGALVHINTVFRNAVEHATGKHRQSDATKPGH
jgi:aspartate racemase